MIISPKEAVQLPLHDARISGIGIPFAEDGSLQFLIDVEINQEEALEPFFKLGVKGRKLTLAFHDCSQVVTNLLGFTTRPEVISYFNIVEQSELKQKLCELNIGDPSIVHFRITGSHGSQLDLLADSFSIAER